MTLCHPVDEFQDVQGQFDQYQRVTGHVHVVWQKQVLLVDVWNLKIYEARVRTPAAPP